MEDNDIKFKLIPFASNKSGNRIFCRFSANNSTLVRGVYDFNLERFIILKYVKTNMIKMQMGKKYIKSKLRNILLIDYDWEL